MNITEFQTDLNNGMTLENALEKHHVTLEQAFTIMHRRTTPRGRPKQRLSSTGERYICLNTRGYLLRKTTKGKCLYMGRYDTLEDAVKVRDYCEEHGWYKNRLDNICKELNVERCKQRRGRKGRYVKV